MSLQSILGWEGQPWAGGDVADAVTKPKPPIISKPQPVEMIDLDRKAMLKEYMELAQTVGVDSPDLTLEAFKEYLIKKDWGIFSLAEVVKYMDGKAATEGKKGLGWEWKPLRAKDNFKLNHGAFGTPSESNWDRDGGRNKPASDYYRPKYDHTYNNGSRQVTEVIGGSSPYDKTVPLHALRKVAQIESEFKAGPVYFFVCDYATAPHITHPDPFLMAVIPHSQLNKGVGRFIIDFWDEPGFGIQQQLGVKG